MKSQFTVNRVSVCNKMKNAEFIDKTSVSLDKPLGNANCVRARERSDVRR